MCGEGILPLLLSTGKMPAGRKEWRGHPGLVLNPRAGCPHHRLTYMLRKFYLKNKKL
jgi:hypothetical protein